MRSKPLAALVCLIIAASTNGAIGVEVVDDACVHFAPKDLPHGAVATKNEVRAAHGVFPEACIVRGTIVTAPTSTITWAVQLPYARMGSDSGHQVTSFYPWALDEVALKNHAFEANHLTLDVGTQVVAQFYGKPPKRRYMLGQSNGGRSGLVAAQRYPNDYDGIIGNIAACDYMPTDLECKGADSDACLTAGQIESIRMVYTDQQVAVPLADGSIGYPRFGRGGAATTDWHDYLFGTTFEARDAFNYIAPTEAAKVVERNEHATAFPHDATRYAAQYLALSRLMDPTDPDLSAFANHGGKLLLWYGTADTCVSIYRTAQYFDGVKQRMGAQNVASFARFLVTPHVGHEMTGPGPAEIDLVSALDAWVEKAGAPDHLIVGKLDPASNKIAFERPACEFPKFARYEGKGDPAKAASFRCSDR